MFGYCSFLGIKKTYPSHLQIDTFLYCCPTRTTKTKTSKYIKTQKHTFIHCLLDI